MFEQKCVNCYTSKLAINYLKEKGIIDFKKRPNQSPVLDIIENCWNVQREVKDKCPETSDQLCQIAKTGWENTDHFFYFEFIFKYYKELGLF